jgi:acetylglutamate kinase
MGDASARSIVVLKLGGELVEDARRLAAIAPAIAAMAREAPLVVVHGGGREIDGELARQGLAKRSVDGVRITDAATLDVVVAVLAGRVNTRLVAAVVTAGGRAVGLTGADDRLGLVEAAPPRRAVDGCLVDLGLVGQPLAGAPPRLVAWLCDAGWIPVVASIGVGEDGQLFNVNADTFAAHLAAALHARLLIIAGATAGVLDRTGRTIPRLDYDAVEGLVAEGAAHAGMVAKLDACRTALDGGVAEVCIVDGSKLGEPTRFAWPAGTQVVGRHVHPV